MSKSFHEILESPKIWKFYHRHIVVLSVDNATQTYKIVIIERCRDITKLGSQNLFLYESMTSEWRTLCKVPDVRLSTYSSIFLKGIFYTLFVDLSSIPSWPILNTIVLYLCDLVIGTWRKIDVNFPPLLYNVEENLQLVVSSGQLYMVKFTIQMVMFKRTWMMMLSIWKIVLETKEVVKVGEIQNFFKFSTLMFHVSKDSAVPVAVVCADSIIILFKDGCIMKFDLLEKHWQKLLSHI